MTHEVGLNSLASLIVSVRRRWIAGGTLDDAAKHELAEVIRQDCALDADLAELLVRVGLCHLAQRFDEEVMTVGAELRLAEKFAKEEVERRD